MADEFRKRTEYLGQSYESCKATLDSLDSMIKACICVTPSPTSSLRALLDEWKTLMLLQRVRLEEAYEGSFATMQSGARLCDTAPLGLQLDSLKWSKLFQTLWANFEEQKGGLKPSTSSLNSVVSTSPTSNSAKKVGSGGVESEDFVVFPLQEKVPPQSQSNLENKKKQKKLLSKQPPKDPEFDGDLCEDNESDDWSSDLSMISTDSNFEQVEVVEVKKPNGSETDGAATASSPSTSSSKKQVEVQSSADSGKHSQPQYQKPPQQQPRDLKFVRDRIMARFQLHQRFGHHLSRDTVTEVIRRAVERDSGFIGRPLPHIYETVKYLLPVALESAKSKYQAPQVNTKLLAQWTFKTKLCLPFSVNGGVCPNGTNCPYAHGEAELRPKRRVALCHQWEERGFCQRRAVCLYAHGKNELGKEVR